MTGPETFAPFLAALQGSLLVLSDERPISGDGWFASVELCADTPPRAGQSPADAILEAYCDLLEPLGGARQGHLGRVLQEVVQPGVRELGGTPAWFHLPGAAHSGGHRGPDRGATRVHHRERVRRADGQASVDPYEHHSLTPSAGGPWSRHPCARLRSRPAPTTPPPGAHARKAPGGADAGASGPPAARATERSEPRSGADGRAAAGPPRITPRRHPRERARPAPPSARGRAARAR